GPKWIARQERRAGIARRPRYRGLGRPRRRRARTLHRTLARGRGLSLGGWHHDRPTKRRTRFGAYRRGAATTRDRHSGVSSESRAFRVALMGHDLENFP